MNLRNAKALRFAALTILFPHSIHLSYILVFQLISASDSLIPDQEQTLASIRSGFGKDIYWPKGVVTCVPCVPGLLTLDGDLRSERGSVELREWIERRDARGPSYLKVMN